MEARSMEVTLISARALKKTDMLSKTKAYAVTWISTDHKNRKRRPWTRTTTPIPPGTTLLSLPKEWVHELWILYTDLYN